MKWIVGSSVHSCWLGHYELNKQGVIEKLVQPGMKVLDIGANAGFYTLACARLVGSQGHVWAIEPLAENIVNLRRHIQINNLSNVTIIQAAVSDRVGTIGFNIAPSNSMGAITAENCAYLVPTIALDDSIETGTIASPDVVKMDVEGSEALVLKGAAGLIRRRDTAFLVALHGDAQRDHCVSILRQSGYSIYNIDGEMIASTSVPNTDEIYAL